jgi:hypothetical protein
MSDRPSSEEDLADAFVVDLHLTVPPADRQRAVRLAIEERESNSPTGEGAFSLAVARNRMWAAGRRLRVRFLDAQSYPNPQVRIDMVLEAAREWTQYANFTLERSEDPDAELRVSFSPSGGCSSYIGTDALVIPQALPTINLSIFGAQADPTDYRKYVLHEFGHALGCIHEHQTPVAGIRWNREVVYADYARDYGWSREKVDYNVLQVFAQASSNHAGGSRDPIEAIYTPQMDKESIMVYPIPARHTLDGYSVAWNGTLSEQDKAFIASVYPSRNAA